METSHLNNSIPEWLEKVDPTIHEKIEYTIKRYAISEDKAREVLQRWCSKNLLAKKAILFANSHFTVTNLTVLEVKQVRHFETRKITTKTEPNVGQTYGKEDSTEELWEKRPFEKFKRGSTKWIKVGSGRFSLCHNCKGSGSLKCSTCNGAQKVTCSTCRGNGIVRCYKCSGNGIVSVKCPNCRGKGFIPKTEIAVGGAKRGGPGGGVIFTKEQCVRCNAVGYFEFQCDMCAGQGRLVCSRCGGTKLLTCRKCRGSGLVSCKTCKSSGRLYSFDIISASVKILNQLFYFGGSFSMKKTWFNKDSGEQSFKFDIDGTLSIQNDPNPPPKDGCVLFERYYIRLIPTCVVSFKTDKDLRLFFVGQKLKLKTYLPLLDPRKIFIASAAIVLIVLGTILLILQ